MCISLHCVYYNIDHHFDLLEFGAISKNAAMGIVYTPISTHTHISAGLSAESLGENSLTGHGTSVQGDIADSLK